MYRHIRDIFNDISIEKIKSICQNKSPFIRDIGNCYEKDKGTYQKKISQKSLFPSTFSVISVQFQQIS